MGGVAAETMIGQIVAHYRITAKIGAGGAAAVKLRLKPRHLTSSRFLGHPERYSSCSSPSMMCR